MADRVHRSAAPRPRAGRLGPAVAMLSSGAAALITLLPTAGADPTGSIDQSGFVGSKARCDTAQTLMAYGRTVRARVAICVDRDGGLEYRGVRLSDGAYTVLPAGRGSDGSLVANNDGVTYSVSPNAFLVSEGDSVLYRDPWVEFGEPRFGDSTASTTSTASTASTASTTVSTTTVTLPPSR